METLKRPSRLAHLFKKSSWEKKRRFLKLERLADRKWSSDQKAVNTKHFTSYQDYLDLQASKLEYLELEGHEVRFRKVLAERLQTLDLLKGKRNALCLAARLGAEVRAFWDTGFFAVGIDLNPGEENNAVLVGDFHHLQFPDAVLDVVYSNSFDHALELEKTLKEVRRILVPDGILIVEADPGTKEEHGVQSDLWATLQWEKIEDLKQLIEKNGYTMRHSEDFEYPRNGKMLVFGLTSDNIQE
jgi:SAM-dependent methyltransferase